MSKYKLRSPSVLSVATTLMSGEENLESELTDSLHTDIEKWINESKLSVGNIPYYAKPKEEQSSEMFHVPLMKDSSIDSSCSITVCDSHTESLKSTSVLENLDKLVLSETSSEKSDDKLSPADAIVKVSDLLVF